MGVYMEQKPEQKDRKKEQRQAMLKCGSGFHWDPCMGFADHQQHVPIEKVEDFSISFAAFLSVQHSSFVRGFRQKHPNGATYGFRALGPLKVSFSELPRRLARILVPKSIGGCFLGLSLSWYRAPEEEAAEAAEAAKPFVCRKCGQRFPLKAVADASVESLNQRAQRALATGKGRLVNSAGEVLDGAATIKKARLQNGDDLTLHVNQIQIAATKKDQTYAAAFVGLLGDGSVVTWGDGTYGGDSSSVQKRLKNVQQIQATYSAFAAILGDGSVVTWGDPECGGDSSAVQEQLKGVQQIQASDSAFAAILGDGSVITWGHCVFVGSRAAPEQLADVQQIQASQRAFAAILRDGSVVTWGDLAFGADSSAVQKQLRDVQCIQASRGAFAALLGDGSVITWGHPESGGDSHAVQEQLRDVRQIQASCVAFAAVRGDGSVVTWGDPDMGGDSRGVQHQLKDVQLIQASTAAFAAILGDGSVVTWPTWGNPAFGGNSGVVQGRLKDVQQIQASSGAFAAILRDGSVVSWGDPGYDDPGYGGDSSAVQERLKNVQQIQASCAAFAAIVGDGSVVTWGDPEAGGDSGDVQEQLKGVQQIQASDGAFAAILSDGSVDIVGQDIEIAAGFQEFFFISTPEVEHVSDDEVEDDDESEDEEEVTALAAAQPAEPRNEVEKETKEFRTNAVHVYGLDFLKTNHMEEIFSQFGYKYVEWLNASSANIVFKNAEGAKKALEALSFPKTEERVKKAKRSVPKAMTPMHYAEAGQGWLASEKIHQKTLTASANDGAATMIARCDNCIGCSRQFCFSWIAEKHLRVERRGEHNDIPNLARIQRVHAKEFAKSHTPFHALKAVRQAGVPASERPKTTQLKVQRPGSSRKPSGEYSVQCRLDLENFAKDPPAGVFVFEEHFIFYCHLLPFYCPLLPFTDSAGGDTADGSAVHAIHGTGYAIGLASLGSGERDAGKVFHRNQAMAMIRPPRPSITNTIVRCAFSHSCHLHVVLVIVIIAIIMIVTISISISISIFFCIFIVIFITFIIFKFILIFIVIFIIISIIIVLIMIILILILVLIILIIMAIVAGSTSLHLQQGAGLGSRSAESEQ
ncbi:putative E3 ubiquitin-protein ligase HERC2 [Symbiodinium microadriaticum]|uniref:Putative E3 ubiquitin-protein ligase HERC2 n=1 Tax=Symbiodinium microadriaticum TaxID=2951 RepID=A0A1Q9CJC5_SYMMI|nr:putative E3 ubiquitin-protein ligase HERC2 [Symbiodinium microadriaticum]